MFYNCEKHNSLFVFYVCLNLFFITKNFCLYNNYYSEFRKCRGKCNKKKLDNSLDNRMQYKNVIPIEFLLSTELSKMIEIPNVITLLRNEVDVSIKVIEIFIHKK